MRRICCFCETWESGGIESFLTNVLLHADLAETEVDIAAACIRDSVFTDALEEKGVRFRELTGRLRSPENFAVFRALLRERRYDAVHFNLFQGLSLYYVRIAAEEGVPVRIAHSHNTALRRSRGRSLKLLLHRGGRALFTDAATELWACSEDAARFLFAGGSLRTRGYTFIPNGIETQRFRFDPALRAAARGELNAGDALVIGSIGRLCSQKNQTFLLDVFAEVLKRRADSLLLLVGEGEQETALREKVRRLGVSDKVIFYGVTGCVERLLCAMDIFAFPSLFEGLGIVAVEAQATGLPVIASEHVPREVYVTGEAQPLALAAGAAVWAEQLLAAEPPEDRAAAADAVRAAGFDIADTTRKVERGYGMQRCLLRVPEETT